jgi:hypothetical protein
VHERIKCSENCRGIIVEARENSGKLRVRARRLKAMSAEAFVVFSTIYDFASEIIISQLL